VAIDPRQGLLQGDPSCDASLIAANAKKRNDVFKAIDNISRVEIDSRVFKGLRTLVGVTKSLGVQDVFDSININSRVLTSLSSFSPAVANNAIGAADNILTRGIPSKTRDFPDFIANSTGDVAFLGTASKEVLKMFANQDAEVEITRPCKAKPYANDLVLYAQKNSFSFVIEFVPSPSYANILPTNFSAFVKKCTRPNIKFEWEELNFYNFRSKVRKRSSHEPISLEFLDDSSSIVLSTLVRFIKIISPIYKSVNHKGLENEGFNFRTNSADFSASTRHLAKDNDKLIFSDIFLYHIHSYGAQVDMYQFIHPKILDINFSDLDMSVSELSNVSLEFDYDSVIITPNVSSSTESSVVERIRRASSLNRDYDVELGPTGTTDGSDIDEIEQDEGPDEFFSDPDAEFEIEQETQNDEDFIDNAFFGFDNDG